MGTGGSKERHQCARVATTDGLWKLRDCLVLAPQTEARDAGPSFNQADWGRCVDKSYLGGKGEVTRGRGTTKQAI